MKSKYDCIIIGGGVAGVAASLRLKREGLSVLLVEKQCLLGGLATSGLINWYEPLCDGKGKHLIKGISEELLILASEYGSSFDKNWISKKTGTGRYATFFDHNIFAVALTNLLVDMGVDISFDTLFTDVVISDNKITAVKVETIDGTHYIDTSFVVDASGTGQVFSLCDISLNQGKNYLSFYVHKAGDISSNQYLRTWEIHGSNMVGGGQPNDVDLLVGDKVEDINSYIINSHKIFYNDIKKDNKRIDITAIPHMPQFRMIRSIVGEEILTSNNLNMFNINSVGVFGYFAEPGNYFELPYGSLYNKKIGNLFAVGRIISSLDKGWDAIRVIPVAALSGDVVGIAIYLANKNHCLNYQIDINELQKEIIKRNIKIHY